MSRRKTLKHRLSFLVLAIMLLSSLCCSRAEIEFYISPEGNDLNNGDYIMTQFNQGIPIEQMELSLMTIQTKPI